MGDQILVIILSVLLIGLIVGGALVMVEGMQGAIAAPGIQKGLATGTIAYHMTEMQVIEVWGEPDDVTVASNPGGLAANLIFGGPDWRQQTIWIYFSPYHRVVFESNFSSGPLYVVGWSPQ